MALALYRKYRPATFAEVVGQEHVTDPLRTALAAGRINHAYLFSGPRGCGKTSSARILARSLNCERGPTSDPCGECTSCINLAPEGSGSIDVVELDAASHGGVDDARELRDRAFYAPAESRYRVFIIDEAHMVTTQGFNALLKIVEEPPEHLVFIFATTEPEKVLGTIRSRTHHYPFRLIPPGAMRALLERNCAAEGVAIEQSVFPLVIRAGGGSARDTQSVLDQLLAGAGPEGVTYDRAIALLGVTDTALIDDMVDALAAHDGAEVFGVVHRLVEAGHDPRRFATDLLDRLRDLVLLSAVPDAAQRGLIDVPAEQLERMASQAQRLGPATLTRFAEITHNGLTEMRGATAPRLLLELLCSRMLLPSISDAEAAVLQRIEQLERRNSVVSSAPVQPAPQRSQAPAPQPIAAPQQSAAPQPPAPDPVPEPAASTGGLDAAAIRRIWPDLLAAVRAKSRSTEAMLTNASVQSVQGENVVLSHTAEPLARRLSDSRNSDAIAEALTTVLGGSWRVSCVHGTETPPAAPSGGNGGAPPAPQRVAPQPVARPAEPPPVAVPVSVAPPSPPVVQEPVPEEPEDTEALIAESTEFTGPIVIRNEQEEATIALIGRHLNTRKIEKS